MQEKILILFMNIYHTRKYINKLYEYVQCKKNINKLYEYLQSKKKYLILLMNIHNANKN